MLLQVLLKRERQQLNLQLHLVVKWRIRVLSCQAICCNLHEKVIHDMKISVIFMCTYLKHHDFLLIRKLALLVKFY